MKQLKIAGALLLAATVTACGADGYAYDADWEETAIGSTEQELALADSDMLKGVVRLTNIGDKKDKDCTGVLLNNSTILLASGCVHHVRRQIIEDDGEAIESTGTVNATVFYNRAGRKLTSKGSSGRVKFTLQSQDTAQNNETINRSQKNWRVALLRSSRPLKFKDNKTNKTVSLTHKDYALISRDSVGIGSNFWIYGYKHSTIAGGEATESLVSQEFRISGKEESGVYAAGSVGNARTCRSDHGAPGLVATGSKWPVSLFMLTGGTSTDGTTGGGRGCWEQGRALGVSMSESAKWIRNKLSSSCGTARQVCEKWKTPKGQRIYWCWKKAESKKCPQAK